MKAKDNKMGDLCCGLKGLHHVLEHKVNESFSYVNGEVDLPGSQSNQIGIFSVAESILSS